MGTYHYQTSGEEMKCVHCGCTEFEEHQPTIGGAGALLPFECSRCHLVVWFPKELAPEDKTREPATADEIVIEVAAELLVLA